MKKHKLFKQGQFIMIEWEDHCTGDRGWQHIEQPFSHSICTVRSMGFVIRDSDQYITIAQSLQIDGEVCAETMTIIKSCINKIRLLK